MKLIPLVCLIVCLSVSSVFAASADFDAEVKRESAKFRDVYPVCSEKMNAGDFAGANAVLLETFPLATRTAAHSFLLGNALFDVDPESSYALHKAAAEAEPQNPSVAWEWGLEQHRAKEYAGALAAYQVFSKARPRLAVPYALQADCLLRLNRVDEAIEAWRQSEAAPDGTLETMEDLVCSVHREPVPHKRRADLLVKATQQRDAQAAADLIALDCEFPFDWWNVGPNENYLSHDAPAVAAALQLPADDVQARAIACAAACATADRGDAAEVKAILEKHRLLIDPDQTIPTHGGLLSIILSAAMDSKAIDDATLRQQIGPKVLALAKKSRDIGMWNAAAFAGPRANADDQLQLERDGWQATGDPRFAAGVLYLKRERGQLAGDDADLVAALKQFPESGLVQRAAFEVAKRENKVTKDLLAAAARAEFTRFTSFVAPATVIDRPRSDYLRSYFAQMLKMPATTKPSTTRPNG